MFTRIQGKKGLINLVTFYVIFMVITFTNAFAGSYEIEELAPVAVEAGDILPQPDTAITDVIEPTVLAASGQQGEKSVLQHVEIRLYGVTEYAQVEIFNRLVQDNPHLRNIVRRKTTIIPANPDRCVAIWTADTREVDTFAIETAITNSISKLSIADSDALAVPVPVGEGNIEMVKKIRPYSATAETLSFVLGRIDENNLVPELVLGGIDPIQLTQGFD